MRRSTELILLAAIGLLVDWAARAPAGAHERARYLCAPVLAVTRAAARLEAAVSDGGQVVPPVSAWRFEPQRDCARAMLRLTSDDTP